MKTTCILAALCLYLCNASARIITLTFTNGPSDITTNLFEIGANEIMRGLSVQYSDATAVYFVKNGVRFSFGKDTVVAGPATLLITGVEDWRHLSQTACVTAEIAPESFPPDKTIIIPEGSGA